MKTDRCNTPNFSFFENNDIFLWIFLRFLFKALIVVTRRRSGFNEYPESMFEIKNTLLYASVILYKSGIKGGIHCLDMFPGVISLV